MRWIGYALAKLLRPKMSLVAENLCLRQQLLVLQRKQPWPSLTDRDRLLWVWMSRRFPSWRERVDVRSWLETDIEPRPSDVRFTPET